MKTVLAVVAAFLLSSPPSQMVCGSGQGSNTAAGGDPTEPASQSATALQALVAPFAASSRAARIDWGTKGVLFRGNCVPQLLGHIKSLTDRLATFVACLALFGSLGPCGKTGNTDSQKQGQRTFASPDDDGGLGCSEVRRSTGIYWQCSVDAKNVLFSTDPAKDKNALQDFVAAYTQMHRWREIQAGGEMLYIAGDNFLFSIPLVQDTSGQ
jgi:hypothetical protein